MSSRDGILVTYSAKGSVQEIAEGSRI
ncbi:MAG: hypothetical protein MZV63_24165 [Marinilabiliales bacterium]|nr:hypothetical protein [Marinilabiliales bacterium]